MLRMSVKLTRVIRVLLPNKLILYMPNLLVYRQSNELVHHSPIWCWLSELTKLSSSVSSNVTCWYSNSSFLLSAHGLSCLLNNILAVRTKISGPLFIMKSAKPITRSQFWTILKKCLTKIGKDAADFGTQFSYWSLHWHGQRWVFWWTNQKDWEMEFHSFSGLQSPWGCICLILGVASWCCIV